LGIAALSLCSLGKENPISQQLPWDFEKVERGHKPLLSPFFPSEEGETDKQNSNRS
jgi:hypothetical protein